MLKQLLRWRKLDHQSNLEMRRNEERRKKPQNCFERYWKAAQSSVWDRGDCEDERKQLQLQVMACKFMQFLSCTPLFLGPPRPQQAG